MLEDKLKEFEPIFYPKSIAVVGASATSIKAGSLWVWSLKSASFPGFIYPVGSGGGRIGDLEIFPSLRLVSGEIDYVIVSVPRHSVLELLDDCAAKNVKAVQFFTAGFSELDGEQGLSELVGEVGSILSNPVDISQAQFRGLPTLFRAIDLVARDTAADVVLIQEDVEILLPIYSPKGLEEITEFLIEVRRRRNKPIIVILPPGSAEAERLRVEQKLLAASIPVFCSVERAAKAIYRLNQYSCGQEAR